MNKVFKLTSLLGFLVSLNTASSLAQPAFEVVEQSGFIFEFQKCTLPGGSVPLKCDFLVQNTGERSKLNIYAAYSRAFDTGFQEISGTSISLGGQKAKSVFSTVFPKGTTLKGTITFEKAPEGGITALDIRCYANSSYFNIEVPAYTE